MSGYHRYLDPLRVPREGSNLRRAFDALLSGERVAVHLISPHAVGKLRDFYNCEIVHTHGPGGGSRLLGRWDGPYFVPVERLTADPGAP